MKRAKLLTHLLVIAILLTIGFGCKSINMPSLGGGSGVSESSNPQEAVTSAFKKFMEQKFYHSVVKTKNAQAEVTTELDYVAPDKYWMRNNIPNYKGESIIIGNDSYMRVNDGKWSKNPAGQGATVSQLRDKMTEESFKAMKDFELVGKESLNGKDAIVFKFKSTYMGESTSKMWIAANTGLPMRVDSEGTYGGTKVEMSITYDYDKEAKIEAPQVE